MEEKKTTIWTKYFILAIVAALFTNICMSMLDSTLAMFASDMWNSSELGGYLTTFFNAGSILMAFFCGRLVDKRGRRTCFILGTVLFALPTFAMGLWPTPAVSLAARFVQGVAKGIVTVAAASMISDIIPKERLGEGMGLYGIGQTLPRAIGPMLGLALTASGSYTMMFVVCAAVYLMAGVSTLGITYEKDEKYAKRLEADRLAQLEAEKVNANYKGVWRFVEKKALPAAINNTVFFFSTGIILVFLTVYARDVLLLDTDKIGLFFTVSVITILIMRLFCGKLSDKYGALCVLIPGHIANLLALLILGFWSKGNLFMFLLAGVLYGIGSATIMPTFNAVGVVDSPKGRNGAANAAIYSLMDVGMLVASALVGSIVGSAQTPEIGYTRSFIICAAVCALSLVMSVVLFNEKARAKRRAS